MKLDWDRDYPRFLIVFFVILAAIVFYAGRPYTLDGLKTASIFSAKLVLLFAGFYLLAIGLKRLLRLIPDFTAALGKSRLLFSLWGLVILVLGLSLFSWSFRLLFGWRWHTSSGWWFTPVFFWVVSVVTWKPDGLGGDSSPGTDAAK